MKLWLQLGFILLVWVQAASAAEQVITVAPAAPALTPNNPINLTVSYTTANPVDSTLTGLGLRVHWNSSQVSFNGLNSVLATGFLAQGTVEADSSDFDGDPTTDQYLQVAWADVAGQWPGSVSATLYTLSLTTTPAYTGTTVRFSASSTAAGYTLSAAPVTLTLAGNPPPVAATPVPLLPWPLLSLLSALFAGIAYRRLSRSHLG